MDEIIRVAPLGPKDPQRLGAYQILGRLGAGGMGVVYLGQGTDGSRVAIKIIQVSLASEPEFAARFRSEVERAKQVPSFCTAGFLDSDLDHDPPFLVTEYVDGPSLTRIVESGGPLRGGALDALAVGVATALAGIHGAGIIHRDLKPGNVLMPPGSPKVIDFGIARGLETTTRHTQTDMTVGTVPYMAPERFSVDSNVKLTPAVDIFAWGCLLTYAGTGRTPFRGDSPSATVGQILSQEPNLDGLPESLRIPVLRSLAKNPADRPTAQQLLDMLVGNRPVPAPGTGPVVSPTPAPASVPPPSPNRRRRRTAVVAVVAGVLAVTGGVGLAVRTGQPEPVAQPVFVGAGASGPVPGAGVPGGGGSLGPSGGVLPGSTRTPIQGSVQSGSVTGNGQSDTGSGSGQSVPGSGNGQPGQSPATGQSPTGPATGGGETPGTGETTGSDPGTANPSGANLALGQPATASSAQNGRVAAGNAVDGDQSTRWGSKFSDPQWLSIDLGDRYQLSKIIVSWERAYAVAYQVQVSTDESTWETVYSTSSGTGGTVTIPLDAVPGRYVRMYGTERIGNYGYSINELEVR